ncbi:hypothetical protein BH24ACT12_BH24ACT12_08910 [soil metagenome]
MASCHFPWFASHGKCSFPWDPGKPRHARQSTTPSGWWVPRRLSDRAGASGVQGCADGRVKMAQGPHRVFLHIGAPKTGTTYLQHMLFGYRT